MGIVNRTIKDLRDRRDNVLGGGINSIPSPFIRFRSEYVGIEKGVYTLITAGTKAGKTQITSYLFLFTPILYSYYNKDKVKVKIFYYPLEETPEKVTTRFISFLLFYLSDGKYRISPQQLRSTNNQVLDEEILKILESDQYRDILNHYEHCMEFSEIKNPTGIYKELIDYANRNGTSHYIDTSYDGIPGKKFTHYETNDDKEYRIVVLDHLSLLSEESGKSLKQSMDKMSEYFVLLRNRYKFNPVVVQQQAFNESNENIRNDRIRPTLTGCSDSKYPSRDADITLGLFSPYKFDLKEYLGYKVDILRDNLRFLEVLANRDGSSNGIIALEFLGDICNFTELPLPNTAQVEEVYNRYGAVRQTNN